MWWHDRFETRLYWSVGTGTVNVVSGSKVGRSPLRTLVLSVFAAIAVVSFSSAEPSRPPVPEDEMVSRYLGASQTQQDTLRGGTQEVDIDASVPELRKHGKLHALRSITKLGKITFHVLGFTGDNTVKTEVIARYLEAEVDAQEG